MGRRKSLYDNEGSASEIKKGSERILLQSDPSFIIGYDYYRTVANSTSLAAL